jgi:thiamine-monophosphate kinase
MTKPTDIRSLGEFGLIRQVFDRPLGRSSDVLLGIGDDCAVIDGPGERLSLVTKDLLLEGVHFRRDRARAQEIGHKALAVNLSDVAAMGGRPRFAVLGLALPPDTPLEWVEGFRDGFDALATRYDVALIGGDTTRSEQGVVVSITLLGEVKPEHLRRRDAARAGQLVAVTGTLGDSRHALQLLEAGRSCPPGLLLRHHAPEPRVAEGAALAASTSGGAMIDLSDGLLGDLGHVCEASGVCAELELDKLPVSDALVASCGGYERALQDALLGGEDYELLVTLSEEDLRLVETRGEVGLVVVGRVVEADASKTRGAGRVTVVHPDGSCESAAPKGFDHFT